MRLKDVGYVSYFSELGDISAEIYKKITKARGKKRVISVDLEYNNGLDPLKNKITLCQIASPSFGIALIRIKDGIIPANIVKLLEARNIPKIFHFAFGDCLFIANHWKAKIKNIVCTKIATRILGDKSLEKDSLLNVVDHFLSVKMDKELQTSNWSEGKFTKYQLKYAAFDVKYLADLWEVIEKRLTECGRLSSTMEVFEMFPDIVENELKLLKLGLIYERTFPYAPRVPKPEPVKEESQNGIVKEAQLLVPVG